MQAIATTMAGAKGAQRRPGWRGWLLAAPMLLWLVAFVVAPACILAVYSLGERDEPVGASFTGENYLRIVDGTDLLPLAKVAGLAAAAALAAVAARFVPGGDRDRATVSAWGRRIGWGLLALVAWFAIFGSAPAEDAEDTRIALTTPMALAGAVALLLVARYSGGGMLETHGAALRGAMASYGIRAFLIGAVALVCWNFDTLFTGVYVQIFARSVGYAGLTALLCLAIGYPVAYYIGRAPAGRRNLLLLLVMIPFWTSFLIRTYAWLRILSEEGLLNGLLLYANVLSEPLEIMYTRNAVLIGLVYSYLPFMILPIYGSVEKLDNAMVEAAFDLGAGPVRAFREVIVPLTKPGIAAGVLLVFVPAIGMFAITDIMGGKTVPMIGNVIQNQFGQARDWPFGAALGVALLGLFALALWVATRKREENGVMG